MNVVEARADVGAVFIVARQHLGDSVELLSFQCAHVEVVIPAILEGHVEAA